MQRCGGDDAGGLLLELEGLAGGGGGGAGGWGPGVGTSVGCWLLLGGCVVGLSCMEEIFQPQHRLLQLVHRLYRPCTCS